MGVGGPTRSSSLSSRPPLSRRSVSVAWPAGALRPGFSFRSKLGSFAVAALIAIAFFATPLGAQRIATQSSTQLNAAQQYSPGESSLAWRFYKWDVLIREWKQAPILGKGLGTTVTAEGTLQDLTVAGKVPHNEYLRYLVETGMVGLMILLAAVVILIRQLSARRTFSDTSGGTTQWSGAGTLGIAIVVGCLVNALADNTFLYTTTGYAVALIVAAVLSLPSSAGQRTQTMRAA
jgi:O-antigen ligase